MIYPYPSSRRAGYAPPGCHGRHTAGVVAATRNKRNTAKPQVAGYFSAGLLRMLRFATGCKGCKGRKAADGGKP